MNESKPPSDDDLTSEDIEAIQNLEYARIRLRGFPTDDQLRQEIERMNRSAEE